MQYIGIDKDSTSSVLRVKCGILQVSILGSLLFLIYVNDLPTVCSILDPIMFADNVNLFFSHKNIKVLFKTVNEELEKVNELCISNKKYLNSVITLYP